MGKVMKFGGTSVMDAERIHRVAEIVQDEARVSGELPIVVVSALGGVTDELLALANGAERDPHMEQPLNERIDAIEQRHHAVIPDVTGEGDRPRVQTEVDARLADLRNLVRGIHLTGECTPRSRDQILSYGERLSSVLVASCLRSRGCDATACDARALIRTDSSFGCARIDFDVTRQQVTEHFAESSSVQVVTGFLGSDPNGATTTLGRGGSDLTASVLGVAMNVSEIEIWTDVDGVMTADPRKVPSAHTLPELTYDELMELSHFGAKVVFAPTVHPAREARIPLVIRNTFRPELAGTKVTEDAGRPCTGVITGISSIQSVAAIRVEGDGLVGTPGIAHRLFGALAAEGVNVILISQASSEHSICLAVDPAAVEKAARAIDDEFRDERSAGLILPPIVEDDQSVLAVVGEGMRERPGVSGAIFGVLGRHGINVKAIAQGSSELNISFVVDRADEVAALRAIHDECLGAESLRAIGAPLNVFLLGVGGVGAALYDQLVAQRSALREDGIELRVAGLLSSQHQLFDAQSLEAEPPPDDLRAHLRETGELRDDCELLERIHETPGSVLVDCTAAQIGPLYIEAAARGAAVCSANKLPFAGEQAAFQELRDRVPLLFHEATVGAGLPTLHGLVSQLETGDAVQHIEGVFSGTLAFLVGKLCAGEPFSSALREAYDLGYTEPDPREDLGGLDVARKLLILARLSGRELELSDIDVRPLIPLDDLLALPLEEFWGETSRFDEPLAEELSAASAAGRVPCYLATLDTSGARVGLEGVAPDHPCAKMHVSDNLFVFTTQRYQPRPLAISGPGAGTALTAAGVFADILRAHRERTNR